ncbi:3-hydroxybutyrate oligomer hydrolase family protein [Exilibacterium tricleocarpae]|nr:3-hydroxybutyrate oligomer hydrolase family protein [Exilibacterium tricleocarpae]
MSRNCYRGPAALGLALILGACAKPALNTTGLAAAADETQAPAFLRDPVSRLYYDGDSDDLHTAGLGIEGLRAAAPAFADPLAPTTRELRRNRIHYNYNAIVNTAAAGGFGTRFGPAPGSEKVAGHEYLTVSRYPDGSVAAVLMVQVPDNLDRNRPCIVTAPSSGSRGVYGAIGTAGAWGLTRNCVVAYTDKGTGTGFYFPATGEGTGTGYDLHGRVNDGANAVFSAAATSGPHRVAVKHSHSGHNVEKDWGRFVLQSVQLAFYLLNHHHGREQTFTRANTLVIASSISNGGASSVRAAEQDEGDWIDAVVVAEPNLALPAGLELPVYDSAGRLPAVRTLLDISTHFALYQGCAALAPGLQAAPLAVALTPPLREAYGNRCLALAARGLLGDSPGAESTDPKALAELAQQALLDYGILADTLALGPFSSAIQLWESLAVTYTNAYGRYRAQAPACRVSFAAIDATGQPSAPAPVLQAALPSLSSGIPPTGGLALIDDSAGGIELVRTLPRGAGTDRGLDTLLCLRRALAAEAVQQGLGEIIASADLQGKPAIIVHGRDDHLINVNHSSRPYLALNRQREGEQSRLHYYEVTHGQHFDALLRIPDFARNYVPLHYYFEQALDLMWEHLAAQRPLPPSQVIRAQPGGAAAPQLPAIAPAPGNNAIKFTGAKIIIP